MFRYLLTPAYLFRYLLTPYLHVYVPINPLPTCYRYLLTPYLVVMWASNGIRASIASKSDTPEEVKISNLLIFTKATGLPTKTTLWNLYCLFSYIHDSLQL